MTKELSEKELKALHRKIRIGYDAKYAALWNERNAALEHVVSTDYTTSGLRVERSAAVVRFYAKEFDALVANEILECRRLSVSLE